MTLPHDRAMRADTVLDRGDLDRPGGGAPRQARQSRIETVIVEYAQLLSPESGRRGIRQHHANRTGSVVVGRLIAYLRLCGHGRIIRDEAWSNFPR